MRKALLLAGPVVLACVVAAVMLRGDGRRQFASLEDCREWAKSHGFRVYPDAGDASVAGSGLWISENPDANLKWATVLKVPAGTVVVMPRAKLYSDTWPGAENARVWGDVAAFGDDAVLEKLELLR